MKRMLIFLVLITLSFAARFAKAQTSVTIIGTVHSPTEKISKGLLLEELNKIRPDVILLELDNSLMNDNGELLKQFSSLEKDVALEYARQANLFIRPFDYKNRNQYYQDQQTFRKEEAFFTTLDSLYKTNNLDSLSKFIFETYLKVNAVVNNLNSGSLSEINSMLAQQVVKLRQEMMYNDLLRICSLNKLMERHLAFWKEDGRFWYFRTRAMTENILKYCAQFKDKKIVVLTGFYHKPFLVTALSNEMKNNEFQLKD